MQKEARVSAQTDPGHFDEKEALRRFREFSDVVSRFSREIAPSPGAGKATADNAELNLEITKTVFSKWSLEIMVMLYSMKQLGFEQIRRELQRISHRVLSAKLKQLERRGLISRKVLNTRPPRVNYSLTEKGLIVARLGEPVFLFFRFEEGQGNGTHRTDGPS